MSGAGSGSGGGSKPGNRGEATADTLVSDSQAQTLTQKGRPGGPAAPRPGAAGSDAPTGPGMQPPAYATLLGVDPLHYRIEGELGRGGMGRIVVARDRRLDRVVALKLLREDSPTLRERFEREARVTARLQHPAIVPVYEAGRLGDEPFYAMRLVSGRPLDKCIEGEAELAGRLGLLPSVIAVAEALAYAHDRGIVHRDVKPQNVLVGRFGETVLIDWGLAKDLTQTEAGGAGQPGMPAPSAALRGATVPATPGSAGAGSGSGAGGSGGGSGSGSLTVAGDVMGTPAYMPPEQARGGEVDERADVYALGAMLYHVLAGRPPYVGAQSWDVVERVQLGPPEPLAQEAPGTPPDLVAIVDKAMARDLAQRYPTAKELAEDLLRFQAGGLVGVHQYSFGEHVRRFARRHKGALAVAAAAFLLLVGLGAMSLARISAERAEAVWQKNAAQARATEAQEAKATAEEAGKRAQGALLELLEEQGRQELLAGRAERAAVLLVEAYRGGRDTPSLRFLLGSAVRPLEARRWRWAAPAGQQVARAIVAPDGGRTVVIFNDSSAVLLGERGDPVTTWRAEDVGVTAAAFSPDGKRLALGRDDGAVQLADGASGALAATWPTASSGSIGRLAWSPDGTRLAATGADELLVFAAAAGELAYRRPLAEGHDLVGWAGDGTRLLVAPDGLGGPGIRLAARIYPDAARGAPVEIPLAPGAALATDTPLARVVVGRGDGVDVIDAKRGRVDFRLPTGAVKDLVLSADGSRAVVTGAAGEVALWELRAGADAPRFTIGAEHGASEARAAELLEDGSVLVTGHDDVLTVYEPGGGVRVAAIEGPLREGWPAWTGGRRLVLVGQRGVAAVDLTPAVTLAEVVAPPPPPPGLSPGAIAVREADASVLAVAADGGDVLGLSGGRLWRGGRTTADVPVPLPELRGGLVVPTGVIVWNDAAVRVLAADLAGGVALEGVPAGPVRGVAVAGEHLWIAAGEGVAVFSVATGGAALASMPLGAETGALAVSADGTQAAVATRDGKLHVVGVKGSRRAPESFGAVPEPVAFSPDGARLLVLVEGEARLVDAGGGLPITLAHTQVFAAAWSPSGKYVACGGGLRQARVFDATTGAVVADLDGHGGNVVSMAWDDRAAMDRLVTAGADGELRVWEGASGRLIARLSLPRWATAVALGAGGLGAASRGRWLRFALPEEARTPLEVAAQVGARARFRFDRGRLLPR